MSKKSKFNQIVDEVAYETGEQKQVVRKIVKEAFGLIALSLITRRVPVLIRGVIKIVIATNKLAKSAKNPNDYETREK
jgi:hypothetical protein